ncbi:MAG: hypothetical protein QOF30_2174 [Acidimicrobiaceae bacterium]|nr:hypothetical protein [Acidimicrobiaceae bacterium]
MIVLVGAILAIGIAGIPTTHHDQPVRVVTTSTSVAPTGSSGTG